MSLIQIVQRSVLAAAVLALAGPGAAAKSSSSAKAASPGTISPELRAQLVDMQARNHGQLDAATLAMKQASTTQVQQLAQKVSSDRTQVDTQTAQMAKERGVSELAAPSAQAQAQSKAVVDKLATKQGKDFDKAYVAEVIRDYEQDEATLKKMRDSQSGKDAALKSWLDSVENVMESGLASARQTKVALDSGAAAPTKAQARTPPRPAAPAPAPAPAPVMH